MEHGPGWKNASCAWAAENGGSRGALGGHGGPIASAPICRKAVLEQDRKIASGKVLDSARALRQTLRMSWNTFGRVLRFSTWGESHGPAIGAIVDGCPPGLALSESDIQPFLDARKPGQNKFTTQRKEADAVRILSGVFEGKTTGTPISLLIENTDQRSKDYSEIANAYRPGHADYAYDAKYGFRDYRGGGRSSARETAMRVAAGAVARLAIPEVNDHRLRRGNRR